MPASRLLPRASVRNAGSSFWWLWVRCGERIFLSPYEQRAMATLTDLELARRLERTEACSNAAFVDSRAALLPSSGAVWRDVRGTYAMYDGVASPCTQTFGLGLFGEPAWDDLEQFFLVRGASVYHEVSPIAPAELLHTFRQRNYSPVELTSVMHCPVRPRTADVRARRIETDEVALWARTSAGGWGETPELQEFMRGFGEVTARARGAHCFVAFDGETAAATGVLSVHGGVALLAGASTLPAHRGRGLQKALLASRLAYAAELGCELAMMCAAPGSQSQRNAEREGFAIAYTRIKWQKF
jgi:GNAT superfamily N-acetyltransferase